MVTKLPARNSLYHADRPHGGASLKADARIVLRIRPVVRPAFVMRPRMDLPPEALTSESVSRNRDPILKVLRRALPRSGTVLEVASGTGEHAVHFAAALPDLVWQPTDRDNDALRSIAAHRRVAALANLRSPIPLDVSRPPWPALRADAVVAINMVHIAPWHATEGLLSPLRPDARAEWCALSLRTLSGIRRASRAQQRGLRCEPQGARPRLGPARTRRRPRSLRHGTASISSSASRCRPTISAWSSGESASS